MSKLNNVLGKLTDKKLLVVIAVLIYIIALVVYDVNVYKRDEFSLLTGYIAAGIMMVIVFVSFFIAIRFIKEMSRMASLIVCIEIILTIFTGISFITSGFLVLSFMVPTALLATVCGLKKDNK